MMISAISSASSANFFPAIDAESFRAIPAVESAPVYRSEPAAEFTPSADYLALCASFVGAEDSAESKTVSSGKPSRVLLMATFEQAICASAVCTISSTLGGGSW